MRRNLIGELPEPEPLPQSQWGLSCGRLTAARSTQGSYASDDLYLQCCLAADGPGMQRSEGISKEQLAQKRSGKETP